MAKVYDVPSNLLITKLSTILKDEDISIPDWINFVKTSSHNKRQPHNSDWWYIRCASIFRKIYLQGPISINDLRKIYGGIKRSRYTSSPHKKSNGSIIRHIVHNLEQLNYVKKDKKGRIITSNGMKKLDNLSTIIFKELCVENQQLKIYAE